MKKILLTILLISLFWSGIINISFATWEININTWVKLIDNNIINKKEFVNLNWENIDKLFEKYLENKKDNTDRWLTFMTILSTLFAVFFVISSFKLDKDLKEIHQKWWEYLEKLDDKYKEKLKELDKKTEQEKEEINLKNEQEKEELKTENNFIRMTSYFRNDMVENWNYENVIVWLDDLLKEDYVQSDSEKINTVLFLLSKAYYWKWFKEWELYEHIDDLSRAIIYINEAIIDSNDPYKRMLIDRFNEMEEKNTKKI